MEEEVEVFFCNLAVLVHKYLSMSGVLVLDLQMAVSVYYFLLPLVGDLLVCSQQML